MTPNNLIFCEHCRSYTQHTFVVNVGVCNVCIKTNKPKKECNLIIGLQKLGKLFS